MNKCECCQKETTNSRFCSRSCSAKITNKIPKRKRIVNHCLICSQETLPKRKYCKEHVFGRVSPNKCTYKDFTGKRKYQKNSAIREMARRIYCKSDKPQRCTKCGYDRHFEVCHIKGISTFSPDTLISQINSLDNLIALCPNCHWELDNLSN